MTVQDLINELSKNDLNAKVTSGYVDDRGFFIHYDLKVYTTTISSDEGDENAVLVGITNEDDYSINDYIAQLQICELVPFINAPNVVSVRARANTRIREITRDKN